MRELQRELAREQKFEGTVDSLNEHLVCWIKEMNELGWKKRRLTKKWMRPAFAKIFIEVAVTILMIDHRKEKTLEIISALVNEEIKRWN